jgi:hypothetical protein
MRLFEAICTAVWMMFACVGALVTSVTDLMSRHPDALLFLIFPLAGALMVVGSFGGSARMLKDRIRVTLGARDARPERRLDQPPVTF